MKYAVILFSDILYLIFIAHITKKNLIQSFFKKWKFIETRLLQTSQEQFLFHHSYGEEQCGMHLTFKNHTCGYGEGSFTGRNLEQRYNQLPKSEFNICSIFSKNNSKTARFEIITAARYNFKTFCSVTPCSFEHTVMSKHEGLFIWNAGIHQTTKYHISEDLNLSWQASILCMLCR